MKYKKMTLKGFLKVLREEPVEAPIMARDKPSNTYMMTLDGFLKAKQQPPIESPDLTREITLKKR